MENNEAGVEQPDELGALKKLVLEFVNKVQAVDSEIETLKNDRKDIIDDYKRKLDLKTLNAALRVVKIRSKVENLDTFDSFLEVLTDSTT